jgi:hypothetical protein
VGVSSHARQLGVTMLLAGALTVGAGPGTATAHGPCRCIEPRIAAPGDELTIPVRTLRAIWNPTDADFNVELGGFRLRNWRHNPASEAITLAESAKPTEPPLSVSVPKVPAGRYMLLVSRPPSGRRYCSGSPCFACAPDLDLSLRTKAQTTDRRGARPSAKADPRSTRRTRQ